jgi:membrane-anchored mycosin MYCP
VDGGISADAITAATTASSVSSYSGDGVTGYATVAGNTLLSGQGPGFSLYDVQADANAGLTVGSSAVLDSPTISLTAQATETAQSLDFASILEGGTVLPATYGNVTWTASVAIMGGATIDATQSLTVAAHNTDTLSASAIALTTSGATKGAGAVAIGTADVNTTAVIHSGAQISGGGTVTIPGYSGGGHVVATDFPRFPRFPGFPRSPLDPRPQDPPKPPPPPAPAPSQAPDAYSGIAPDVDIISIRQSSQAFGLKDAYTGDEDPQTRAKIDDVETMARAIVHATDMGATVINISDVTCMSARNIIDQRSLGAAVHYAAVDKNVVIVAAAGDTSKKDCKQNPAFDPMQPKDPRDWSGVTTVVTPSWFSDYVLTVGAVDTEGRPLTQGGQGQGSSSVAGPWVGIAAPGTDVIGLSPRDDGLINAIDGPDNTLLVPAGTSFSTAIVSGVAALVRAKYPQLSAYQVINRLERTARAPARGVDNQVGHGVIDPVAALTWDVPDGPAKPPQQLSSPLNLPKPAPRRDMVPVWVAAGGLTGALLIAGAVFGTTTLMKRSRKQQ